MRGGTGKGRIQVPWPHRSRVVRYPRELRTTSRAPQGSARVANRAQAKQPGKVGERAGRYALWAQRRRHGLRVPPFTGQ
jgi:hypothetical protein